MNFHQLDLNLLVALHALLDEKNITLAGKRVHLTQSAMSGALARLRQFFGDELLVQVGRKMVPTPLGESLIEPVREILIKVKATVEARPGFDPKTSTRRFSMMMSDFCVTALMIDVTQRAETLAPGVSFEILSNNVEEPHEFLDRADVDLLVMPDHLLTRGHPQEILFEDDFVCIAWNGNDAVGESLTLEQYLELGHVICQFNRGRTPIADEWYLQNHGHTRHIEVMTTTFNAIPLHVVNTRRIATLHSRLARYYARILPIRLIVPPVQIPPIKEAVQWHSLFANDPGVIWLRQLLKESAAQLVS
jgi:LysR family transcriptional regulator, nod-box dependent transcriptional activator